MISSLFVLMVDMIVGILIVRKILGQLEELGALMRVGERPRLDSGGVAHGGQLIIWSIPKRASEGAGGVGSQARPDAVPSAPKPGAKRASEGAPLKVEVIEEEGIELSDQQIQKLIDATEAAS